MPAGRGYPIPRQKVVPSQTLSGEGSGASIEDVVRARLRNTSPLFGVGLAVTVNEGLERLVGWTTALQAG
jgi:hypothetical protein